MLEFFVVQCSGADLLFKMLMHASYQFTCTICVLEHNIHVWVLFPWVCLLSFIFPIDFYFVWAKHYI